MRLSRRIILPPIASLKAAFASIPFLLWLIPILWLSYALRVFGLGNSDLWMDEAVSAYLSGKSLVEILAYCASSIWEHPPGYYVILHAWRLSVGDSEFALRLLSTVGGVLTVVLLTVLARRWFGRGSALLVALLMAVQPMAIQYGREARMYAWLMAAALLSVYLLDRAVTQNRWRDWVVFLVATLLCFSLHYLAVFFLLAYGLFLAVCWRELAACRWRLAAVLAILVLPPLLWIVSQPGPRSSLLQLEEARQRTLWSLGRLEPVYTRWALGGAADTMRLPGSLLLASVVWLLAVVGIVAIPRPQRRSRRELRWLLGLLIVVPPLAGSVMLTVMIARQYSAMLGILILAIALGIQAIFRSARLVGITALAALTGLSIFLGSGNTSGAYRPFSPAIKYIVARARPTETLVYTHYLEWALNSYYNRPSISARYIPQTDTTLSSEEANREAAELVNGSPSLWLMLFPGLVNTERMESALNNRAFPSEKVWFAGGRGVVHYFAPVDMKEQAGGVTWDERISLNRWWASDEVVAAGDALRLQFEWRGLRRSAEQALVALRLVGSDGTTWAERIGEPCNGHCATTEWSDEAVIDRQALYVPPDVPPGDYTVRLAWLTSNGQPLMGQSADEMVPQVDVPLMQVHVGPPAEPLPNIPPPQEPVDATLAPGLRLRGVGFKGATMAGGGLLTIPLQWEVTSAQPALDARLALEGDTERFILSQPLGPGWYPSVGWRPGQIVRVQPQFLIPGTVPPGTYNIDLAVAKTGDSQVQGQLELGELTIHDRPRRYSLPTEGKAVAGAWQENIQLVRVVAPGEASAGNTISIAPVWRAGGPTTESWKVFIHLLDSEGNIRAQSDGYPAGGQALTPTWQRDEVVVDTHPLSIPATLPKGDYFLRIGFYDERSAQRLLRPDGSDSLILPLLLRVVD